MPEFPRYGSRIANQIGGGHVLSLVGVRKQFGETVAVDDVSLQVAAGEIVGLVGENGAGKSTMLSILAGYLRPDAGRIEIAGNPVTFRSPADAIRAGIGLVHQHLSLVLTFTVREQLRLAGWTQEELPAIVASLNPESVIESLSLGERQRIEIAKALVPGPSLLLLDEPTTILAPGEVHGLFATLRDLRAGGTSVVIVTHKLSEVMDIADRIVVMAQGRARGKFQRDSSGSWAEDDGAAMLTAMFGRFKESVQESSLGAHRRANDSGARPLLMLASLTSVDDAGGQPVRDVNLTLEEGRIHAIAGIDGSGQRELARIIAGYRAATGSIHLAGSDISDASAMERAELGMRLLVDDRLGEGAIGSFTIAENLVLKRPRPSFARSWGVMRWDRIRAHARAAISRWDVNPADADARYATLSGGNMQRVLAARELSGATRVLIALNPVQGLDARTAAMLWDRLRTFLDEGGAVLVFTTDLDEAFDQGDVVAVIARGRVSPFLPAGEADRRRYAGMMVNGW